MGGALAGGGATLLVAEKAGLSPAWAGAATGGLALAGSALLPNPALKDACFAAGLGGMGVAGVQLLAGYYTKRQQEAKGSAPTAKPGKRQADGDTASHPFVTRDELNQALAQLADKNDDQHKQTCDLMTALHDEIRKVVAEPQPQRPQATQLPPGSMPVRTQPASSAQFLYPLRRSAAAWEDERNAGDDEYMRNAYGDELERNADFDERNAAVDEYERNAYGEEYERNAYVDDERNAFVDDERNAYTDEERNADERDADVEDRNAALDERDADVDG